MNNKIRADKSVIFMHFLPYLLSIYIKFEFLISQGSVATCLRWGGSRCISFVSNLMRFPTVQKFWKSVKIWQSYGDFKGANFFETQCSMMMIMMVMILHCRLSEDDDLQDQEDMDPEIAAAYEQFLAEMMQNEPASWATSLPKCLGQHYHLDHCDAGAGRRCCGNDWR